MKIECYHAANVGLHYVQPNLCADPIDLASVPSLHSYKENFRSLILS
jgi:hypothetical protein